VIAVPEPASLPLAAGGLMAVVLTIVRTRRRFAQPSRRRGFSYV